MTDEKSAFLFIDDAFIENLDNVVKGVVPAKKVSQQPMIEKDQAWEEEWLIGSYINVMYDDDENVFKMWYGCLLYTSPSPRDGLLSRMPSSA